MQGKRQYLWRAIDQDGDVVCPKTQTNSRLARRAVSIVITPWRAPDQGRVGGDVGDSGSPHAQGKHRPATGCYAPWAKTWIQGSWAKMDIKGGQGHTWTNPGLDSEALSGGPLFPPPAGPVSALSPIWRKRGTRKSRLETKTENEASSALLAHLWCHLPLQNPANRAENLNRLCSATMYRTGWRMGQFGAIRSRLETIKTREKTGN